jgi:flagellar L-ring protein precursor FlgH
VKTHRQLALLAFVVGTVAVVGAAPARAQDADADPRSEIAPEPLGTPAPRPARASWTADRRSYGVGDVITVLIDEQTLATATTGNFASDRRSRDLFASGEQTITNSYPGASVGVGSINDAESRQRGESLRRNRFVGEMTVRVVAVENGLLHVSGSRTTSVDKDTQEMMLTGWVRPEDVSYNNLVESWRIGDAEIRYASSGRLGKPRGGFITRFIGWLWP